MVKVVEEHFVPTMTATKDEGHNCVKFGPSAVGVLRQKPIPRQGMSEVGDEHPCQAEASATCDGHRDHKFPAICQSVVRHKRPDQPDDCPASQNESIVVETARQPLAPE